ncbi:hypothetical protein FA15DRAFT_743803, partial [Coprinopsis marcescibilis]
LYRHLEMLENLVPNSNKPGARLWIDVIFFRVSAMLSYNQDMDLNVEQPIPSIGVTVPGQTHLKIGGTIDYAIVATESRKYESFIQTSQFQYVKRQNPNPLFITKAKQEGVTLRNHIPQAVARMFASAKYRVRKEIARGTVTNGHEWIFIILYINQGGIGGTYATSPTIKIQVSERYPFRVISPGPDIIAGTLFFVPS